MIHIFTIEKKEKKRIVIYIKDRLLDIMVLTLRLNRIKVIRDVVRNLENVWISIMKI